MKQQQQTLLDDIHTYNPAMPESEPLTLNQLLNLIVLADERGQTVKSAHDLRSASDPISNEIYSVWFAIENELLVFAHNIPSLIEFAGMKYSGFPLNGHGAGRLSLCQSA